VAQGASSRLLALLDDLDLLEVLDDDVADQQ
jgi:hypothetical protein